jgi:hypothetical protein
MTQPAAAFAPEQDRINALRERESVSVTAGHADLGEGLWISCDPEGRAEMTCRPEGDGFRLGLSEGDSGRWTSFGLRLPVETLARGRYMGLLVDAAPEALVSFTPALRYAFREGGMQDVGTPLPVILPAGPHEELIHLPIDPELLERAGQCELNLFFHTDRVEMPVTRMELLLMV